MSVDFGGAPERLGSLAAARPEWVAPRPPWWGTSPPPRLAPRARWAQGLLVAMAVIGLVALISDLAEHSLLERIARGEAVGSEADASDLRQTIIGVVQFLAYAATIVFFLRWFRRAYGNLPGLGASHTRWSPGWAIGGWFVPVLALWRPKQVANDIWRASDPDDPPDQHSDWRANSISPLLTFWWAAWLIDWIVNGASNRVRIRAEGVDQLLSSSTLTTVSDALGIVSAIAAILVVRAITARQDARIDALAELDADPAVTLGTQPA